jgi:hypothetical protein
MFGCCVRLNHSLYAIHRHFRPATHYKSKIGPFLNIFGANNSKFYALNLYLQARGKIIGEGRYFRGRDFRGLLEAGLCESN